MCNCIPATRGRNTITSWSGQSPDTPEQGRLHPRTRLTRLPQTRFYDTGQALAWSEAGNASETRSGDFTAGSYTSMLAGEYIQIRILNIFMMGKLYLKYVSRRSLFEGNVNSGASLLFR